MYKTLLKRYIEQLKKDDVRHFIEKNHYQVNEHDLEILYQTVKTRWEDLYDGNCDLLFLELKEKLAPDTFVAAKNLYYETKNKINF